MKEIEEFVKYSILFEAYKSLFTGKQRIYLEAFLEEDNSFTEIAQAMNVSRQAIFDTITKACKKLDFYEENLEIVKSGEDHLNMLKELKKDFSKEHLDKLINELEGNIDV